MYMRNFILLSAIPGSGKSTWAKQYAEKHPNTYIVSSDEIRSTHFKSVNDFSHENDTWRIFLEEIHDKGKEDDVTVIADSTNLTNEYRKYYAIQTPEFDHHTLVMFQIPYEICQKQNQLRKGARVVPQYAMDRMKEQFEDPSEEVLRLYDETITVGEEFVSELIK